MEKEKLKNNKTIIKKGISYYILNGDTSLKTLSEKEMIIIFNKIGSNKPRIDGYYKDDVKEHINRALKKLDDFEPMDSVGFKEIFEEEFGELVE